MSPSLSSSIFSGFVVRSVGVGSVVGLNSASPIGLVRGLIVGAAEAVPFPFTISPIIIRSGFGT